MAKDNKKKVVSARKRVETHNSGSDWSSLKVPKDVEFFKIKKAGTYRFDIIPYVCGKGNKMCDEGELSFELTYFVHNGIGSENKTYVCPNKTWGKPCPMCQRRNEEWKNEEKDQILIDQLKPKERQLFNVIDVTSEDKNIKLFEYSFFLFGKFLDNKIKNADEDEGFEYFADLEKGFTIRVGAVEKKYQTYTFFECSDIEFKARKEPLPESLIEEAHCLEEMLIDVPYEKLKKIFLQIPDEEEKKPSKKVSSPKEEDEEDEEVKKPVKKVVEGKVGSLKVHDLVIFDNNECEIIKISPDGTSLNLEGADGETYKAVHPKYVRKVLTKNDEEDDKPSKPTKQVKKPAEDEGDEDYDEDDD